jgi:UDP-glucuronate decarboxylase
MQPAFRRILVTGGAGFIGSHLCDRLIEDGGYVVCLDNFYTGSPRNVDHLVDHARFEVLHHDVCDVVSLEVDQVYHLACPASPVHYQRHPVETIRTCVQGTLNMLDLCRRTGARLLLASTSEVYGDPAVHPQPETYWGHVNPIGDRACYDEGKRCAEALVVSYARQFDVDSRIARIFNTYGPRLQADDGRVVSSFVSSALRGKPLTVFGDGLQTRSFCFVDDLVDGLVRLMASGLRRPVNLGNPTEISILQLVHEMISLTGSRAAIVARPLPPDDPVRRRPDISVAKDALGWEPIVPLMTGLESTIAYFRRLNSAAQAPTFPASA